MNNKFLLVIAAILVFIGMVRPDFSSVLRPNKPSPVVVVDLDLEKPTDAAVLEKCANITSILKSGPSPKTDGKRLASLYIDIANLISLDGDNTVIKDTEEIKQANSLSGILLHLDLRGKYPNLSSECNNLIEIFIGGDHVLLDDNLRKQAVSGFRTLAWACNEGSK